MKKLALGLVLFGLAFGVQAQDVSEYDYNSLRPIRNSDKMYKNSIWWRMDMREKQNEPFFADGNEITKLIIDAVKAGVLRPFESDQLENRMALNTFLENLKLPDSGEIEPDIWDTEELPWDSGTSGWDTGDGDPSEGIGEVDIITPVKGESEEYFAKQMPILEIKGNMVFDKKRSKMYREIETISIVIPGEFQATGIDKIVATFSYKELVENVFVDNPSANWFNATNSIENRNFADAFDLALETAKIIKYSNPQNKFIDDIYNGDLKQSLSQSQAYNFQLLEYEANAWSN